MIRSRHFPLLALCLLALTRCADEGTSGDEPPLPGTSGGAAGASTGGFPSSSGGLSQPPSGGSSTGGASTGGASAGAGGGGMNGTGGSAIGGNTSGGSAGRATGGALGSSGGKANAGAPGTGGAPSAGGVSAGGASGGSGGSAPNDNTIPTSIPKASNGSGEIRATTTVLKSAANGGKDVWDFENQKIGVQNTAECEGGEGQLTVFEVGDGVTVKNLIIYGGMPGGNGIVCTGNCTLDHVYWEDVCEDAATNSKDGATMTLDHVIALHATDKVFQHNAKGGSKTVVKNSYISDFGKLWRSCGDCTSNGGPRHLVIDNVRVEGVKTSVAGANQNYGDTVTITNLYVKGGYDAGDDAPRICQEYQAVTDHMGESMSLHDGASQWNTATCKVSQSDIKSW